MFVANAIPRKYGYYDVNSIFIFFSPYIYIYIYIDTAENLNTFPFWRQARVFARAEFNYADAFEINCRYEFENGKTAHVSQPPRYVFYIIIILLLTIVATNVD